MTHLYWFELPWDCLSGDKKKEKKKHASTIVKQLSSWPHLWHWRVPLCHCIKTMVFFFNFKTYVTVSK